MPTGRPSSTPSAPDPQRMFALTTRGTRAVHDVAFRAGRLAGVRLGDARPARRNCARRFAPAQRLRLPMRAGQRSLNLSNAVAVTVFEAWRQNGFAALLSAMRTQLLAAVWNRDVRLSPPVAASDHSFAARAACRLTAYALRRTATRFGDAGRLVAAFALDRHLPGHLHAVVVDRRRTPAASCAPRRRLPTGTGAVKRTLFSP